MACLVLPLRNTDFLWSSSLKGFRMRIPQMGEMQDLHQLERSSRSLATPSVVASLFCAASNALQLRSAPQVALALGGLSQLPDGASGRLRRRPIAPQPFPQPVGLLQAAPDGSFQARACSDQVRPSLVLLKPAASARFVLSQPAHHLLAQSPPRPSPAHPERVRCLLGWFLLQPHSAVSCDAATVGGTPSQSRFSAWFLRTWRWALVVGAISDQSPFFKDIDQLIDLWSG